MGGASLGQLSDSHGTATSSVWLPGGEGGISEGLQVWQASGGTGGQRVLYWRVWVWWGSVLGRVLGSPAHRWGEPQGLGLQAWGPRGDGSGSPGVHSSLE